MRLPKSMEWMDTYLLIDTGATVPVMSKVCFENVAGSEEFKLAKSREMSYQLIDLD